MSLEGVVLTPSKVVLMRDIIWGSFCVKNTLFRKEEGREKIVSRKKNMGEDNRGMTLLEVIIAVAIFSIAAIVLMEGFVTSGRINRKSNLYLEATTTAQNVMEEMKAKSFENTALAFNYPVDMTYSEGGFCRFHFLEQDAWNGLINSGDGNGTMIREMLPDGTGTYKDVLTLTNGGKVGNPESATVLYDEKTDKYIFNPRTKDAENSNASQYFFEMRNVTNRKETFDVLVTFDGSSTAGYKTEGGLPEGAEGEKNDYLSPNIAKLDQKTNGFLAMEEEWAPKELDTIINEQYTAAMAAWTQEKLDWEAKEENWIKDKDGNKIGVKTFTEPQPKPLIRENLVKELKRTLTVTLKKKKETDRIHVVFRCKLSASGYNATEAEGKYAHFDMCPCKGTGYEGDKQVEGCFCTARTVDVEFYSATEKADLKNLYVFYYPNYESNDEAEEKWDIIEFFNQVDYPVDFYLVKMKDPKITDMVDLSNKENGYAMKLNITEAFVPGEMEIGDEERNAATRLRTNLDYDISKGEVVKRIPKDQMMLTFEDKANGISDGIAARKNLSCNGIEDRQPKDRIYKVHVGVYKQGAAEKGFQDRDDLVAFLDGSRED